MRIKDINKNWRKLLWRWRWNRIATLLGKIKRLERSLQTIMTNREGGGGVWTEEVRCKVPQQQLLPRPARLRKDRFKKRTHSLCPAPVSLFIQNVTTREQLTHFHEERFFCSAKRPDRPSDTPKAPYNTSPSCAALKKELNYTQPHFPLYLIA